MPYADPGAFVGGLITHDHAARQDLARRFRLVILSQVTAIINRNGLATGPAQMVDRQLRTVEMFLISEGTARFATMAWPEFDRVVEETSQAFLSAQLDKPVVGKRGSAAKLPASPAGKLPRGLCLAGAYSIRWCNQPVQHASGDFWDCQRRQDGSILVMVGDVTGHGPPAALLTQGVPFLFHACLKRQQTDPVDLARLRNEMDQELSKVLPLGCFVQAVLCHFHTPETGNTAGDSTGDASSSRGSAIGITPSNAIMKQHIAGNVHRTLAMTACLLGIDYEGQGVPTAEIGVSGISFPKQAEIVACTDGLLDQPVDTATPPVTLRRHLIESLPSLSQTLTLFDQVLRRWREAVDVAHTQVDDTLIVSLRHATEEELRVFKVLEHDPGAQQWFFAQFKRLVWKLVNAFSKNPASEAATQEGGGTQVERAQGQPAAEDKFQEAFWHLFQKLPQWSGGNLYAWVRRSTINYLISCHRKGRKSIQPQRLGQIEPAAPSSDNPEMRLAVIECLEKTLRGLSSNQRQLLEMVGDKQSPEQICSTLSISRRTYFNWLGKIRDQMKKCLEGD